MMKHVSSMKLQFYGWVRHNPVLAILTKTKQNKKAPSSTYSSNKRLTHSSTGTCIATNCLSFWLGCEILVRRQGFCGESRLVHFIHSYEVIGFRSFLSFLVSTSAATSPWSSTMPKKTKLGKSRLGKSVAPSPRHTHKRRYSC